MYIVKLNGVYMQEEYRNLTKALESSFYALGGAVFEVRLSREPVVDRLFSEEQRDALSNSSAFADAFYEHMLDSDESRDIENLSDNELLDAVVSWRARAVRDAFKDSGSLPNYEKEREGMLAEHAHEDAFDVEYELEVIKLADGFVLDWLRTNKPEILNKRGTDESQV